MMIWKILKVYLILTKHKIFLDIKKNSLIKKQNLVKLHQQMVMEIK